MSTLEGRFAKRATKRCATVLAGALLLAALTTGPARAAGTSPVLALVAVDAFSSTSGGRLVVAEGAFNFEDLVQIPFPAAGLVVVQGARFALYDVDGGVREGTSAQVADGIDPAELASVIAAGGAVDPPARLVQIAPSKISVVLPPSFVAGPATVALFAIHEDESFVSNAISLVLP